MKIEYNPPSSSRPRYPCLMKLKQADTDEIVLFVKDNTGICIKSSIDKIGEYSENWKDVSEWEPVNGEVKFTF